MTQAVTIGQDLTALAFVALGAAIAYRWFRVRSRPQAMLTAALVSLGAVAVLGRLQDADHPNLWLSAATIVLFLASGFFVLLFRHELIPLPRRVLGAAYAMLAAAVGVGLVDQVAFQHPPPTIATLVGLALVVPWAVFTGEPIVRFWVESNALPAVQRARLRFLSFGFAVIIALLFGEVIGGSAARSPGAQLAIQLIALVTVPAIYISFAPPAIVRRVWRMSEEDEIRAAMQDLLIFSPTRAEIAQRGVYWAVRMVGARAGFVADPNGKIIATSGVEKAEAARYLAEHTRRDRMAPDRPAKVVTAPLHLTEGDGTIAIIAGPFTPLFGSEEILQLRAYANSVAAGIERARVTERMAALESNKTQFLNLASHELRGPVTVIRGYVSMLESGMLGDLNDRGRQAARTMAAKVSEMNELIEEMIEAARLEEGGLALHAVDSDLREIARRAVEMVAPMLEPKHRLELDLGERRVLVSVDPERTRTIVTNLLSNAIKYSPDGGTIACQVRSRAGLARVTVTDEGLGISKEGMATLFTRFGRVVTPKTEHLKGTGLGLFLARQLARLQGGDITVASVEGKGSTFTLQLPAAPATAETPAAPEPAAADGAGVRPQPARTVATD